MEPQQTLFGYLLTTLQEKGYQVYDGALPDKDALYPFIYLNYNQKITRNAGNTAKSKKEQY